MKRVLFALLIVVALLVAPQGTATAVTDGVPDGDGHPYVGFMIDLALTETCSGVAVSPDVLVSVAHCGYPAGTPVVVTFEPDLATAPMESFHLGFYYPDPAYDPTTGQRDLAVVVFADPVSLPRFASLPTDGLVDTLPNHQPVDLAGYGATDFPLGGPHPLELGTMRMTAESKLRNRHHHGSDWAVAVMAIPGIGHGEGTGGYCIGDSGSPVLLGGTDVVLGIHSFGPNCHAWTAAIRVDTPEVLAFIGGFMS